MNDQATASSSSATESTAAPPGIEALVTIAELAGLLKIEIRTYYALQARGELPHPDVNIGSRSKRFTAALVRDILSGEWARRAKAAQQEAQTAQQATTATTKATKPAKKGGAA